MKKIYQTPKIEIFTNGFDLMQSLGVTSQTTSQRNYDYGDTKGRSSYDKDDEAYFSNSSDGSSSYGDLW